jgi:HAE1 family hydrophobic/amphiphilic exporter-1
MRQALGTAVFFGMLGVTFFGLVFTPVFYVTSRWVGGIIQANPEGHQRRQNTGPDSGHGSE